MAKPSLPDPETLRQLIAYDPETGSMTWRERGPEHFKGADKYPATRNAKMWNTKFAGQPALSSSKGNGALGGSIFNVGVRQHRIAWAIHTGAWPEYEIDHINGNPRDNRLENLRDVRPSENMKNLARPKNNTSGHIGVSQRPKCGRWRAYIKVDRRHIEIGLFGSKDEAIEARKAAEKRLGFHKNHGRVRTP